MIPLTKGPKPNILRKKAEKWTAMLLALEEEGAANRYLLTRYNNREIKSALLKETSGKCAYCESPIKHITYGDIEHITPKAIRPDLRFEWTNLTIACDVCNTKKSNTEGLVDPYSCDPRDLFIYLGPLIWAKPSEDAAMLTEEKLELNRDGLVERRKERLEYLRQLIASAVSKPTEIKEAMLDRARREIQFDRPYAACGQAILELVIAAHES